MTGTNANRSLIVCLLILLSFTPSDLLAWSVEGHQAVALIAMQRLQGTNTATRVKGLLGTLTLADIAICPDEVRALEQHHIPLSPTCKKVFPNPPKGTANWHFVDIPIKDPSFEPTASDVNQACGDTCVLTEIDHFLSVLSVSKPSDSKKKKLQELQALSFCRPLHRRRSSTTSRC